MKYLRAAGYFISTLIIYLGVTLLGWGLGDMRGYFSDLPRLGYAITAGLFSLGVGFQAFFAPEGINGSRGEEGKFVRRQRILAAVLVYSMLFSLFFVPYTSRRGIAVFQAAEIITFIGVAFSASGYTLIFASGVALGRQYSPDVTIQKNHRLVTSGVYRFIRHPRYLGIISLATGVSLVFCSWIGLLACLFFSGVLLFRIRDEEQTMHNEFGGEWESYRRRSWRLIPYLY